MVRNIYWYKWIIWQIKLLVFNEHFYDLQFIYIFQQTLKSTLFHNCPVAYRKIHNSIWDLIASISILSIHWLLYMFIFKSFYVLIAQCFSWDPLNAISSKLNWWQHTFVYKSPFKSVWLKRRGPPKPKTFFFP